MYLFEHPDFPDFITQVADARGIPAAIVEKDYWVTYVLHRLKNSEFSGKFIFKGGTSLSKGWGIIERFSEDIDLLFVTEEGMSVKQKRKRLEKVRDAVGEYPGLSFDEGNLDNSGGNESRCACFTYARKREHAFGSLHPYLKLEMGYRGGTEPHTIRKVQSYIGEALGAAGQLGIADDTVAFEIEVLHPRRTFVEKLFAIHAAAASGRTVGQSRHYYDIFKLLKLKEVREFIGTDEYRDLKQSVYDFSKAEFPKSPLIEPQNLRESPGIQLSDALEKSLQRELEDSEMLFGDRPTIKAVIAELNKVRKII